MQLCGCFLLWLPATELAGCLEIHQPVMAICWELIMTVPLRHPGEHALSLPHTHTLSYTHIVAGWVFGALVAELVKTTQLWTGIHSVSPELNIPHICRYGSLPGLIMYENKLVLKWCAIKTNYWIPGFTTWNICVFVQSLKVCLLTGTCRFIQSLSDGALLLFPPAPGLLHSPSVWPLTSLRTPPGEQCWDYMHVCHCGKTFPYMWKVKINVCANK